MIAKLKSLYDQKQINTNLLMFLAEAEKNLENFYVTDQRQFITNSFVLDTWNKVKNLDIIRKHEEIIVYIRALETFNALHKEHKAYEQWYGSDMNNKTAENARKLHGMKHDLDNQLKGMEAIIIFAGQAIEKELIQMGLLKT